MNICKVKLGQIIKDKNVRINIDTSSLRESIMQRGLLTPLLVEGPNEDDKYYLCDGYRRYEVLKELFGMQENVHVYVIGPISSTHEREIERFHMHNTSKKMIGIEEQFMIESIQKRGQYSHDQVVKVLNPKKHRIKRMEKSSSIDEEYRKEIAKVRGSQHALEVIFDMEISDDEWRRLYNLLLTRKLTGEHADALKRLSKHRLFNSLDDEQKSFVIKQVIRQAKFTSAEAELIVLSELMRTRPKEHASLVIDWIDYLCQVFEETAYYLHDDIKEYANEFQRSRLRSAFTKLNRLLSWTWSERREKESNGNKCSNDKEYVKEQTKSGYKFRKHKIKM
jgi:ParB-like chromosome segregation protein Spo0J